MKFHFSKIEISENYIYRLLNNSGKINIRNIESHEGITCFIINYEDKDKLQSLMDELNIKILKQEDQGIYTHIVNFPFIKLFIGVTMIFILLMMINSLFIWKISVDGNYSYSGNQIISYINKQKITEGMVKSKIDCNKLEKSLRNEFNDMSWVCAEIKGTNLIIHIKENYITEISVKEDKPYDIISNRDGKIKSILVKKGKAMVKAGDTVKKGDILITGVVDVFDESEQKLFSKFCNADGCIMGETNYDYRDSLKINYTQKITKKKKNIYLPSVFQYKWIKIVNTNSKNIICSDRKFKMFGNFYLPLSIQKYTIINYKNTEALYSKNEAEQMLNQRLLYKLTIMEQKGYKILKKNVKINKEKDSYVLSGKIECLEPLGTVSYIDVNQIEEGTTEINERN